MTQAELAILSLVAEQPRHGYEIEQVIQERGMREWTEVGFSSIYYLLKKLEGLGFLEGRPGKQSGRGPAPKIYEITPDGLAAWREAVLDALSVPRPSYSPLLLGLANLPYMAGEALQALWDYRQRLTERRKHVYTQAEKKRPLPEHVEAMFDFSLAMIDAEIRWVGDFIQQLEIGDG